MIRLLSLFAIAVLLMLCVPLLSEAKPVKPPKLSENQETCILLAYKYGQRVKWRGEGFGETVASILFQESKANYKKYQKNGVVVGDGWVNGRPKSLGPMQVQIPTARDIEKWYPEIFYAKFGPYSPTDEELIIALLTDIEFNIQCGAAYFQKVLEIKQSWRAAILSYNRGPGNDGADPNDYINRVMRWRKEIVRPILKKHGLI